MSELKACPVMGVETEILTGKDLKNICAACRSCPNRAPSLAEVEMREALEVLIPVLEREHYPLSARDIKQLLDKYPKGCANQCDGCARGLPIKDGIHMDNGHPWIVCTKDKYPKGGGV